MYYQEVEENKMFLERCVEILKISWHTKEADKEK